MDLQNKRIVITGGAGFVGSHLTERLVADNEVVVVDDFRNSERDWVHEDATVVEGDLIDDETVVEAITPETDIVFHFAADKDAARDDIEQYRVNNELTETVVERMHAVGVEHIAFTSSSVVYGEAPRPTPEDFAPLEPISIYGASKLGEEGLLSVFAHSHGFTVWNFRFANIVGPRLQLGSVIPDFIQKLEESPDELEILGDGRQEKSYLHIGDCVDAMCHVVEHADAPVNTYNLGTRTTTSVTTIADIVADEMGLDPEYSFTGGDRGWTGDVPRMRLSVEKLSALGWEPEESSDDAVRRCVQELLAE
ncbi:NAD-dependent epimerase/dehydratase family protein [Halosegnis rubeus]|jgi:UDP-glucose 4-epimerase|uniref:NAD-dependent epimerase/dehydratase family protein n=1 Tax=Halosegnis rubeus TaxID=2212850 RepID=A0A5N5ULG1_9EURY|nr:NAD-dependent epimerase/dehydratase family protein [Halosegnis rubeus]KAB7513332.1 NAD-dependent epimerase/dehydratase family protein [Halosegnis rubeus]KAB7517315.1 NAD-dependent epimerase/dehydratase family protein [Halosegnis rubeus]KAB7518452.1 NAD-dependent epimerase/dehydratase family protein [Halosegnis rubeus]